MTNEDEVKARFAATAEQFAAHSSAQVDRIREEVAAILDLRGDERVLDSATGAGALALALAPLVREVVGVDIVPELLAAARRDAPPNVTFVEADATSLPFGDFSFDIAASRRTLHHVARPELVVAELVRVTQRGGTILVEDQIAPVDPLDALELDRFERARDPSHTRLLPDVDLRQLFEANGLVLRSVQRRSETRALAPYLDLAGCGGDARNAAESLAPGRGDTYRVESAWYVLRHG
ncbi:MAG: methyltransferase domain-containing protein [Actinobacteria bacterium]|nr:MAG: methyltransferase domain-containing protein [Actinomycetota bacterium]